MRLQLLTKKKRRKDQQQHQLQHVNAFEVQITWQSGVVIGDWGTAKKANL